MTNFDAPNIGGHTVSSMTPQPPDNVGKPCVFEANGLSYCYGGGSTALTRAFSEPKLIDVNCSFWQGCRVLVVGSNGAGKSTLLSIMGGKRMVPQDQCRILGKPVFHDTSLNRERMYCGDWWRTDFFFNITVSELIGERLLASPRVQKLIDIMQIDLSWRINAISDGQRRRCQLLECLAEEKSVYILDEITTDLDLYARENLLSFLMEESVQKGAAIFYATHIFDNLADWATHLVFFSKGRLTHCARLQDVPEYRQMCLDGVRTPLYRLLKEWIFAEYPWDNTRHDTTPFDETAVVPASQGPVLELRDLSYSYGGDGTTLQLEKVNFSFARGSRILVVGGNGAGKSTVLAILGGKRMVPRGHASILGLDCFHDPAVSRSVMYCGDWWRTKFFMNMSIGSLLGESVAQSARCRYLANVLHIDLSWNVNDISDGMRRRCQLLECLSTPRSVYLMDEISSDLDMFSRVKLLDFLCAECKIRGATIFYCTHIFDHLEGWASHILHLSKGRVARSSHIDEVAEYSELLQRNDPTPLYSLIRRWIHAEYEDCDEKPWRNTKSGEDGRLPNLGLAGPFQVASG